MRRLHDSDNDCCRREVLRIGVPAAVGFAVGLLLLGCAGRIAARADRLPIAPARTVSFETSEGTGMNVDLSPDGSTLVFDLLGDLYTMPVTGGRATQLTRGLAVDRRPVWSPDGRHIAYVSDGTGAETVWIVNVDGSKAHSVTRERPVFRGEANSGQVTSVSTTYTEVEWLPDGTYLISDDTLYHRDGVEPPGSLGLSAKIARFTRDNRHIYFVSARYSTAGSWLTYDATSGLRRYDRQTRDTVEVLPDPSRFREPAISPDGAWLAYVGGDALRLRNLASGADREVAKLPHSYLVGRSVFTPDSKNLIISYDGKFHRIEVASGQGAVIPFSARVNVDLGRFIYHRHRVRNDSVTVRYVRAPDVSPDGKTLVFSALQRLYTMALPDGTPKRLVNDEVGQFQPAYSPDGRWIAYVTWSDVEGGHVWRIPAAGGRSERLTSVAGYYQRPAWSPDGGSLAVLKGGEGNVRPSDTSPGSLHLLAATGGTPRKVVEGVSRVTAATFSADGQRLFFLRQEKGELFNEHGTLNSIRLDGSDQRVVARLVSGQPHSWGIIAPSPDGRYLAFSVDRQLYLARASDSPEPAALEESAAVQLPYGALDRRWAHDSRSLTWVAANQVFQIDPDHAMASGPRGVAPRNVAAQANKVIPVRLTVPRHTAQGTLVLRGARVITMKGDEVIEGATIVIRNDRIVAVGAAPSVAIPAGATVLDVSGKTIIPGFVDLHAHLHGQSHESFFQQPWQYLVNLAYGVTTSRDANGPLTEFGDAELIEAGRMLGPRVFNAGPIMAGSRSRIESLDDARTVVQRYKAMGAVVVKQYEGRPRRLRQWIHQAADEAGLNVTGHDYFDMILDGTTGVEHGISAPYEDVARLRAEARTWHTTTWTAGWRGGPRDIFLRRTTLPNDPKYRRFTPAAVIKNHGWERTVPAEAAEAEERFLVYARQASDVVRAGGNVTVGSHGDEQGIGLHWETWALQLAGFTNHEALRAATLRGAEGLGMQENLGSLEGGKIADLIVLERNPLENIEHTLGIRYVMKNGVLYDGDTLDTLWPTKHALPTWMYQDQRP